MTPFEKKPARTYVLDTNVLLHDPISAFRFEEHDVVIPMTVLEELDRHKQGKTDLSRTARHVVRMLSKLIEDLGQDGLGRFASLREIESAQGATGRLYFLGAHAEAGACGGEDVADNRIIAAAKHIETTRPDHSVVMVSKDVNLRVKCAAWGLMAEDYHSDRAIDDIDAMPSGMEARGAAFWDGLDSDVQAHPRRGGGTTIYEVEGPAAEGFHPGLFLVESDNASGMQAIVRETDGAGHARIETLHAHYGEHGAVWGVRAHDAAQNCALNALLDPQIDLVSIAGVAGTGKTFLALAAALHLVLDQQRHERIVITRETVAMGEEIGFLPGSEEEKMAPWMGAFSDNMESLIAGENGFKDPATKQLLASKVQMRSLSFMRGRTFNDTVLIIDEIQNLTPKQVKSLLTRAGRNTKVIALGNVAQIDTPYLTEHTCGLATIAQEFRHWPHAAHVTLKNVERSRLAMEAEQIL